MSVEALSSYPIGEAISGVGGDASKTFARSTILSQYANSPILIEIVDRLALALDHGPNVDAFFDKLWNVATAQGYGLDVLGRIVGVNRVLRIPAQVPYIGWASDAYNWGNGIWAGLGTATRNYSLTDSAFRRLVLAKAALNISDGSAKSINAALMSLFPNHGNCYVRDNGGMAMTYVFGGNMTAVDYAIIAQSGVLPKPVGVSVMAEVTA
jgi:hypothetical protein